MAVDDLPLPLVNLLNAIGVPWPYINEQTVFDFASLVRKFRQAVITTHEDATEAVRNIAKAHKGASAEVMTSGWANLTASQVDQLTSACTVFADALDGAGVYIVTQKGVAIAELIVMAAEFAADQVAAFVTAGWAEAGLPLIEDAAARIVVSLEMDLSQYIVGKVIEQAAKPLLAKMKMFLSGLDWSQSGGTAGSQKGLWVDPAAVAEQAMMLRRQSTALRAQGQNLAGQIRNLKFT